MSRMARLAVIALTDEFQTISGSEVTVHIRPFVDIALTAQLMVFPSWWFPSLTLGSPLASANDMKPFILDMPNSRVYPWSSMLLIAADMIYSVVLEQFIMNSDKLEQLTTPGVRSRLSIPSFSRSGEMLSSSLPQ